MQSAWNGWPAWQVLFYDSLRLLVLQRERLVKGFIMSNDFMTLNGNFFLNCCQNAQKIAYLCLFVAVTIVQRNPAWRAMTSWHLQQCCCSFREREICYFTLAGWQQRMSWRLHWSLKQARRAGESSERSQKKGSFYRGVFLETCLLHTFANLSKHMQFS